MTTLLNWLRWVADVAWANACWAVRRAGYWVRPYDMLADARRWRWQPRQRCGGALVATRLSDGHAWVPAAAVDTFGEEGIRRMFGVEHVHRAPEDGEPS